VLEGFELSPAFNYLLRNSKGLAQSKVVQAILVSVGSTDGGQHLVLLQRKLPMVDKHKCLFCYWTSWCYAVLRALRVFGKNLFG